jgi:leucyl aminopeptidase
LNKEVKKSPSRLAPLDGFGIGEEISSKAPPLTLRVVEAEEALEQIRSGAYAFVADSLSDPSSDFLDERGLKRIPTEFGAVATMTDPMSRTVILLVDTRSADSARAAASSILKGIQFFLNRDEQGRRLDLYVYPNLHNKYSGFCSAFAEEVDLRLGDDFPHLEFEVKLVVPPGAIGGDGLKQEANYINVCYRALKSAKQISNLPPNLSTPRRMAEWARALFKEADGKVVVRKIRPGEGQFQFSQRMIDSGDSGAEILEITYTPEGRPLSHVSLIGKGVTFDAGGLALKPWKGQELMKYDKIGAVVCLLATHAAASIGLPVKITTYVVFCENLLDQNSIKPGSVYKIGRSDYVEVNNPDGEGRLLLADCLHYIASGPEHPDSVITVATLTGDSFDAFGDIYLPYFTNDARNEDLVGMAAQESGEKVWRMPLDVAFKKYLSSGLPGVIKNYSNSTARLITSACFISQFAREMNWIHFDMAGVSVANGTASGRPLPFLINLLKQFGNAAARTRGDQA